MESHQQDQLNEEGGQTEEGGLLADTADIAATMDNVPGEMTGNPERESVKLQEILDKFDPLRLGSADSAEYKIKESQESFGRNNNLARNGDGDDAAEDVGNVSQSSSNTTTNNTNKYDGEKNAHNEHEETDNGEYKPVQTEQDNVHERVHKSSMPRAERRDSRSTIRSRRSISSQTSKPKRIKESDVLPFDFQWFLDQLRHKSADPIARYVKSFLSEFNKRPWSAKEQVKIIGDFKAFIANKMMLYAPFSKLSDQEFLNAQEGMEKLIMNRVYNRTFSPEIAEPYRSDSHEEDVIRDRVLAEKMRIWHWIEGRHLDLQHVLVRNGEAFVRLASDELNKINHYRAPRDKMICILNCCKVIFGLLRQTHSEESADDFLPVLIYVVIKAQPKDLISNVNYIQRFRNPDMLSGEAAYYLSSLIGAISFVETLDRSGLSISDEEFERNVESSVRSIVEPETISPPHTPDLRELNREKEPRREEEEERQGQPIVQQKEQVNKMASSATSFAGAPHSQAYTAQTMNASNVLYNSAGLITAPFKSLTKFFEGESEDQQLQQDQAAENRVVSTSNTPAVDNAMSPEESAARQASAEEHEARRVSQAEFENVCKTLKQMFPDLDHEVIQDVLRQKQGRVGAAVDVCLALVES